MPVRSVSAPGNRSGGGRAEGHRKALLIRSRVIRGSCDVCEWDAFLLVLDLCKQDEGGALT